MVTGGVCRWAYVVFAWAYWIAVFVYFVSSGVTSTGLAGYIAALLYDFFC